MSRPVQRLLFDEPPAEPFKLLPLDQYDLILVSYSGGKDSLACLLHLLDLGVPRSKLELHHNDVDGHGEPLMDWPCTPAYVKATGEALGLPVVFSWREGGFVREMLRDQVPTAPVSYEREGQRRDLLQQSLLGGRVHAGVALTFEQPGELLPEILLAGVAAMRLPASLRLLPRLTSPEKGNPELLPHGGVVKAAVARLDGEGQEGEFQVASAARATVLRVVFGFAEGMPRQAAQLLLEQGAVFPG